MEVVLAARRRREATTHAEQIEVDDRTFRRCEMLHISRNLPDRARLTSRMVMNAALYDQPSKRRKGERGAQSPRMVAFVALFLMPARLRRIARSQQENA